MKRHFKYVALVSLLSLNCSFVFGHKLILDKGISKNKSSMACLKKTIRGLKAKGSPTHFIEEALNGANKTLTIHVSKAIKSPQISSISTGMKITLPHLYSRWCTGKDQRYLVRKTNKKIKDKLNKELNKGVNEIFTTGRLSGLYDQLVCALQEEVSASSKTLEEKNPKFYKLNEKTGAVYNIQGKRVKNKAIIKWLVFHFHQMRVEGNTSHIIKGGKLKDKIVKEKLCEVKSNQCLCVIEKTTLAPQYSLSASGESIKVKTHHSFALDYTTSRPFVDSLESCGVTATSEHDQGEDLSPPPTMEEETLGTSTPKTKSKTSQQKEIKAGSKTTQPATAEKKPTPLTAQENAERQQLLNIPVLNASGVAPTNMPGMNIEPATANQNSVPSENANPSAGLTISESNDEDPYGEDGLLDDADLEGNDTSPEDEQQEERSLMDSGGNIYTSTRVFSPNGFIRQLKEDQFVCYKPQYSQETQVTIFRFEQEDLEDLEASGHMNTEDDVFPFFNYLCLKKVAPEME